MGYRPGQGTGSFSASGFSLELVLSLDAIGSLATVAGFVRDEPQIENLKQTETKHPGDATTQLSNSPLRTFVASLLTDVATRNVSVKLANQRA